MKQMGSAGNDRLAQNGGVAVVPSGDLLLYGDTNGSFMRDRSSSEGTEKTDIFLFQLDGSNGALSGGGASGPASTPAPVTPITAAPITSPVSPPSRPPHAFVEIGAQLEGPLYGGGLVYDSSEQSAIVAGTTYKDVNSPDASSCLVASLDMVTGQVLSETTYGSPLASETCSAIDFSDFANQAFVVGGSPQGGFGADAASTGATQVGFLFATDDEGVKKSSFGTSFNDEVTYPVAVVADPFQDGAYVLSLGSDSAEQNALPIEPYPLLTGAANRKYGKSYFVAVEKYIKSGDTLTKQWYQKFAVDDDASAFPSGMALAGSGSSLIVAGSTKGSGGSFGTNSGDNDTSILTSPRSNLTI